MALTIREYLTADGKNPFRQWLDSLPKAVKARIQARVLRFELGNLGDHKSVGEGVWEAPAMFGPGYRIYFGKDGDTIIVLLVGGDKGSQLKDIARAQRFWCNYLEANNTWQGDMRTGISVWRRICGIENSPASSCLEPSMTEFRSRSRWRKSSERWA